MQKKKADYRSPLFPVLPQFLIIPSYPDSADYLGSRAAIWTIRDPDSFTKSVSAVSDDTSVRPRLNAAVVTPVSLRADLNPDLRIGGDRRRPRFRLGRGNKNGN